MYVLVHPNNPDRCFENSHNAFTELDAHTNAVLYQYLLNQGYWIAARRYYLIEDREVVFNTPGNWEVPDDYVMYNFPNFCSVCNSDTNMQGSYCLLCHGNCPDCGSNDRTCGCAFTDY